MLQRTFDFRGGEAEGLKRLHHYLWGSDAVAGYFNTRNGGLLIFVPSHALGQMVQQVTAYGTCSGVWFLPWAGMTAGDDSTKFSPWLANGCLSSRQIYHEIKKYEAQRTSNKSTYWVRAQLSGCCFTY